jgi:hypothetical protein
MAICKREWNSFERKGNTERCCLGVMTVYYCKPLKSFKNELHFNFLYNLSK